MQKQSTLQSSYEFKTCPTCGEFVKKIHKYCGHCSQQLQTQCPQCGIWTLFLHKTCPECGTTLHEGPSFAERQLLQTLKQRADALYDRRLQSGQSLTSLTTERKRIVRRLVVVGVLIGAMIDGALSLVHTGIGILVLVIVVIFGARLLLSLSQGLYRWASPGSLTWVRQEIEKEKSAISFCVVEEEEIRGKIAELENPADGEDGERGEFNPLEEENKIYQPVPGEEDLLSVSYQSVPELEWLRGTPKRKKFSFSWFSSILVNLKKTRV